MSTETITTGHHGGPRTRRAEARVLSVMYLAGIVITLVTVAADGLHGNSAAALAAQLAVAAVVALGLVLAGDRTPPWAIHGALVVAVATVTVGAFDGSRAIDPFVPMMLALGAVAAAVCTPRQTAGYFALIATGEVVVLTAGPRVEAAAGQGVTFVGTLAITMGIVAWLVRRVRSGADEAAARAARLVEAERTSAAILDAAPAAFVATDASGRIVGWNRAAESLLGWTRQEAIGRDAKMMLPERFTATYDAVRAEFFASGGGEAFEQPLAFAVKDRRGAEIPAEAAVAVTADEDGVTFSAFITDARVRMAREVQVRERVADLETLARATRSLAEIPDPQAARQAVCQAGARVADSSYALLFELDLLGRELVCTAVSGMEAEDLRVPFSGPASGAARAYAARAAEFVPSAAGDPALPVALRDGAPACFQPIVADEAPLAVLVLVWRSELAALPERRATLLRLLADEAAVAMQRADVLARLEEVARTDELTGLLNRRGLDEQLAREVARARRSGAPLCVAMLDLDHFKRFNDQRGHQEGDRLLREAAAAWSGAIRPTDVLARFGGEEFLLVLADCDLERAVETAERLRRIVPAGETCSAGVACWDGDEAVDTLVGRADRALYDAKRAGRDCVVSAEGQAASG